jgi:histone H3/H4
MSNEVLVVASKVKDYIKTKEMMSSGDLPEALSDKVRELIDAAVSRANENGRKTVKACDL